MLGTAVFLLIFISTHWELKAGWDIYCCFNCQWSSELPKTAETWVRQVQCSVLGEIYLRIIDLSRSKFFCLVIISRWPIGQDWDSKDRRIAAPELKQYLTQSVFFLTYPPWWSTFVLKTALYLFLWEYNPILFASFLFFYTVCGHCFCTHS